MRKKLFATRMVTLVIAVFFSLGLWGCSADKTEPTAAAEETTGAAELTIPRLYFEGNIAQMNEKTDIRKIAVSYEDQDHSFAGYAQLKVQGSSSLLYPKKNYTIKFYQDAACEMKSEVDVGWGAQNEYCLKANWIDKTHSRNVVTAKLAAEVQEKYGLFENTPNHGLIDGFPVEIYVNGEFHGLYTFNIPKAAWMFNMDETNPNHLVFCGEDWLPATQFRAAATYADWALEVGQENEESLAKLNRLIDFITSTNDEVFKAEFEKHINLDAALNYYILTDFAYLVDNTSRNMLMVTYDGEIWYPSLYDLDTSWGTTTTGVGTEAYWDAYAMDIEGSFLLKWNLLFSRMTKLYARELSDRYFELRKDILSEEAVLEKFYQFRAAIPEESFARELAKWGPELPGSDLSQIEEYLRFMTQTLDDRYFKLAAQVNSNDDVIAQLGESGLPKLNIEGNLTRMVMHGETRRVFFTYQDGVNQFNCYGLLTPETSDGLGYEKQNYSISFCEDAACTKEAKQDMGWGDQSRYTLYGNWVDKTHARNLVTADLVAEVQAKYKLLPDAPNRGVTDGYPVEVYANGEYLGLYTLGIPKSAWMFGMDENNPNHMLFYGADWGLATQFRQLADFSTWRMEAGTASEESLAAFNEMVSFVMFSRDETFKEDLKDYINLDALLNYYILTDFACLADNTGKNMMMATYDGRIWYPSFYDLDTSWGANWDGLSVVDYASFYAVDNQGSYLLYRVEQLFGKELSKRYFELRKSILTEKNIMEKFQTYQDSISTTAYAKDQAKWGTERPGFDLTQIQTYLKDKTEQLDAKYTMLGAG